MSTRAKVTLTSLNGNLTPAQRLLTLDVDQPSIQVGRASKTLSKGLQGAHENAWFDSPVMSRDHAEISYDTDQSVLRITDIGSMHGTIVNNVPLAPNVPIDLTDGDRLVFGAEVRRGPEIFPACAFRINYDITRYRPSNTFCFPENSDMEDEAIFEFSDMESENDPINDGGSSVDSAQPKAAQNVLLIDLTKDDSASVSRVEQSTHEQLVHGRKDEIASSDDDSNPYESDDESDIANQGVVGADSDSELDSSDDAQEISDSEDGGDLDEDSEIDPEVSPAPRNRVEIQSSQLDEAEIEKSDSIFGSDDSQDEDFSTTVALPSIHDHLQRYASAVFPSRSNSPEPVRGTTRLIDLHRLMGHDNTVDTKSTIPDTYPVEESQPLHLRAPSPSDAAMAKTQHSSASIPSLLSGSTAILGHNSGKEEFFKAREENKALLARANMEDGSLMGQTDKTTLDEPRKILKLRLKGSSLGRNSHSTRLSDINDGVTSEVLSSAAASRPSAYESIVIPQAALRINDIVEDVTPDLRSSTPKRRLDEISETTEEEVRAWASVPTSQVTEARVFIGEVAQLSERPRKRLRTVLEKVGYAAVGGVAVGAALFSSLVVSAPDFL